MTGMTDISRHGGDKKHQLAGSAHRNGHGIQVKDDALIDPALLGEIAEYSMQAENLVDDSDDDGGYELGDAGPGMATKVVQAGFKLLFFPLILVYRGITSLRYIPQLCGQILAGVKNGPATFKRSVAFFLSIFSLNSRLGKVLIVIGTFTGVIWLARKFYALGASISAKRKAKRLAAEEAALEAEIRAEEAAKTPATTVQVQPESHRKATATVQLTQPQQQPQQQQNTIAVNKPHNHPHNQAQTATPELEPEEPKSRRRIGFGQLSKIASAFKRSEPVTSPDAASPNNEDRYDSFETSGNRWSTRKSMLFAASCLMLLIGGVTVARQVMHKNDEVAQNIPDEEANQDGDTDQYDGTQPPDPMFPGFGEYPGNPGINGLAPQNPFPNVPDTGLGTQGYSMFNQPSHDNTPFWEQASSMPIIHNGVGDETPSGFAEYLTSSNQGGSVSIGAIDESEESAFDERRIIPNDMQRSFGVGATDYDDNSVMGSAMSPAPLQDYSGYSNDLPDSLEAMPVVQPQPGLVADIPVTPYAATGANQNPLATIQPEQSFTALQPSPHAQQDRGIPAPLHDNSPALADISRTSPNNTPGNIASSDTGLSNWAITSSAPSPVSTDLTPSASSGLMSLTQMNSTNTMNESNEQNAWTAMPSEPPMTQPMPQPMSQPDTGFEVAQNESPAQTPSYIRSPEPIIAAVAPMIPAAASSFMNIETPAIPATSPRDPSPDMSVSVPQVQTPVQTTSTIAQLTPVQPINTQPINAQPIAVQPVNMQQINAPVTFSNVAQDNIGDIISNEIVSRDMASNGIVSPSQHIAAMPMVSSDTQASFISHEMPPAVVNATSTPAHSSQLQSLRNTPAQPFAHQASSAQFASDGQNSMPVLQPNNMPVLRPNNTYVVQPGDSIYKIAKQELGSVRRYREIYELNRDRLPIGQDTLTVGIELLLPVER